MDHQRKPLSYESLKCVVQYMDATFRTIHAPRFPSLQHIQKSLPLRLDTLMLDKSSFKLDNLDYSFHLCQEFGSYARYPYDERFVHIEKLPFDLGTDGFEDRTQELMPGDIAIEDPLEPLYRHHYRFEVIYGSYVSCDIWSGSSSLLQSARTVSLKLGDTIRKQLDKVLGGRRIHQVKRLKIEMSDGVLRLPEGLKLKIQELTIEENGNNVIKALRSILDESSFPLKSLSIEVKSSEDPIFQNEILRSAEVLNIKSTGHFDYWAQLLISLPCPKIHCSTDSKFRGFRGFGNHVPVDDIAALARNWMEHPRNIGTRFSIETASVEKYLAQVANKIEAAEGTLSRKKKCRVFPKCYTLPMTSTSDLTIHGAELPDNREEIEACLNPYMVTRRFMLVLEVMPKGSVQTPKPLKQKKK